MSRRWLRVLVVGAGLLLALAAGAGVSTLLTRDSSPSAPRGTSATSGATLPVSASDAAAALMAVGFGGVRPSDDGARRLSELPWGAVVIERENSVGARQVRRLVEGIRERAEGAHGAAPVIAMRQAGGEQSSLPGLPPAPQADQLVAREAGLQAREAAAALRGLGVELTLAPIADLAVAVGPAAADGFSRDPEKTADMVRAAVAGYREGGVASAPGSFPGQGAASQDPSVGPATVGLDLETLSSADLRPFVAAAPQAPVMQMSVAVYAAWDGVTPASLAPEAYDLLRRGARFGGVAMTGDLNAATAATGGTPAEAAIDALRAGADLLWIPGDAADQDAAHEALTEALERDPALRTRAAEALARLELLRDRYANP